MSYSKVLALVIEDDSRVSRLVRSHFEEAFPGIRVEIAGSAAKAAAICARFRPTLIIWDGTPNERGTRQEYLDCIPEAQWKATICISMTEEDQEEAQTRGARKILPKRPDGLNAWADDVVEYVKAALRPRRRR